jgi:hypothetical protein
MATAMVGEALIFDKEDESSVIVFDFEKFEGNFEILLPALSQSAVDFLEGRAFYARSWSCQTFPLKNFTPWLA